MLYNYCIYTDEPDTIASALVEAKLIDARNLVVGNVAVHQCYLLKSAPILFVILPANVFIQFYRILLSSIYVYYSSLC